MKQYQLVRKERRGSITTLTMRPARPRDRIEFRAGQYVAVGFRRFGRRSPMRCFSLTGAPNAAGELQLAFRRQGDFTEALAAVAANDKLYVAGPFGNFTVPHDQQYPLVYLAAGIGVTPFMSLLRDQAARGPQVPTVLLWSCRSLDDAPFAAELLKLAQVHPWLTVRFIVGQVPSSFTGHPAVHQGRLDAELLDRYGTENADYYLCGPSGYNRLASGLLAAADIDESQVHTEAFGQGSRLTMGGFDLPKLVYTTVAVALFAGVSGTFLLDNMSTLTKAARTARSSTSQATNEPSSTSSDEAGAAATPNSDTSNNPSADTGSQSQAPSTTTAPPAPSYSQTYQPPVSSVS